MVALDFEGYDRRDGRTAIYALVDPRDCIVRYVGRSVSPWSRFKAHLYSSNGSVLTTRWARRLRDLGLRPQLWIVEICNGWKAAEREQYWSQELLRQGHQARRHWVRGSVLPDELQMRGMEIEI